MDTAASPVKRALQHLLNGSMQDCKEKRRKENSRLHNLQSADASLHHSLLCSLRKTEALSREIEMFDSISSCAYFCFVVIDDVYLILMKVIQS